MLNLKEVDKINEVLTEFLHKHNFECRVRLGSEFAYYPTEEIVQYSFTTLGKQDKWFTKFFQILNPNVKADIFLLSFFHELGHYMTLDDVDDDAYELEQKVKANLDGNKKADNFIYFGLTSELAASMWAANFMQNHADEIELLWNTVQKHIIQFYEDNGVTE